MNIIIDTNIWVSFTIGKRLQHLKPILINPKFKIYICNEILEEYNTVIFRPKIKKYISNQRIKETIEIIKLSTINENRISEVHISRDKNDDFLLAFSLDVKADFIITGDNDLLVLKKFNNTNIVTFEEFIQLIKEL